MPRRLVFPSLAITLVLFTALFLPKPSHAGELGAPQTASSAYDLINAVNVLRASYGQPAYSISPILMYAAQTQADYMAAIGDVTHTGPGGSTVTQRLLAAGYPLAGDLSLGGFRSENITGGGEGMTAQDAVNAWTGDAPHLNTMISPNLSEIGAGVTVSGGRVYYVIDAALPTTGGGGSSVATPIVVDGTVLPSGGGVIVPITVSTPNADGDVIHDVLGGQSLWQIAIDYGVKIDDIKRLNNLSNNDIYPGEKLLIRKGTLVGTEAVTETASVEETSSPTATLLQSTATITLTHLPQPAANNNTITGTVIGIIAIALVIGGLFTWMGNTKKE